MATFIFNKDEPKTHSTLKRICENDEDLQYYPVSESDTVTVNVEDFLKIKNRTHSIVSHDGNNFTWFHHWDGNTTVPAEERDNKEAMQLYLDAIVEEMDVWLAENPSHVKTTEWQNYRDYCNNIDLNTVTFPLNKSWEEYCSDNSVNYKSIFELPIK